MTIIIDGKKMASEIRKEIAKEVEEFKGKNSFAPKLVVVLVGKDPASELYVKMKAKACEEVGIESQIYNLSEETKEEELLKLVRDLNQDKSVHGILVQFPLPKQIDAKKIVCEINPSKDVDGFHPVNIGRLYEGLAGEHLLPCTPKGIMKMLERMKINLEGKEAVVVGRSIIVGRPVASMLLNRNATVTVCHSKTKNLGEITRKADILVSAVGKERIITRNMVKEGAVVIDCGTSRKGGKSIGDVDFENVKDITSYITPVPGGVGPMTVAMLLENTLEAAKAQIQAETHKQ